MTKKYIAIIPARGGSKRLPKKNILKLAGKELITWTIKAALECKNISKTLITSDDQDILDISSFYNVELIKRPSFLAQDTSSSIDAIIHALEDYKDYEYTILLQPTSPLRSSKNIKEAIKLLEEKNADAIVSVSLCEHSPLWTNTLDENRSFDNFLDKSLENVRSQDLNEYFRLNGAIYICKTKKLLEEKNFYLKENIYAYVMKKEESIDIDDEYDFIIAQSLMEFKNKQNG